MNESFPNAGQVTPRPANYPTDDAILLEIRGSAGWELVSVVYGAQGKTYYLPQTTNSLRSSYDS